MTGYYSNTITISKLIRDVHHKLLRELVEAQLQLDGTEVSLTETIVNGGGKRLWFKCPECKRRCGKLIRDNRGYKCIKCISI